MSEPKNEIDESDLKERSEGFGKELTVLLGKYELGLGATANLTLDGRVEAKPVIMSQRGVKQSEAVAKETPAEEAPALAEG